MHNLVRADLVGFILFLPNVIVDRLTVLGIDMSRLGSKNYTYQCGLVSIQRIRFPSILFIIEGQKQLVYLFSCCISSLFLLHHFHTALLSYGYLSSSTCFLRALIFNFVKLGFNAMLSYVLNCLNGRKSECDRTRAGQFINHELAPVQSAPSEACRAYVEDWHAQTVLVQGLVNLGSKGFRPRVKSPTCSAIPAEAHFYFPHNYIA